MELGRRAVDGKIWTEITLADRLRSQLSSGVHSGGARIRLQRRIRTHERRAAQLAVQLAHHVTNTLRLNWPPYRLRAASPVCVCVCVLLLSHRTLSPLPVNVQTPLQCQHRHSSTI